MIRPNPVYYTRWFDRCKPRWTRIEGWRTGGCEVYRFSFMRFRPRGYRPGYGWVSRKGPAAPWEVSVQCLDDGACHDFAELRTFRRRVDAKREVERWACSPICPCQARAQGLIPDLETIVAQAIVGPMCCCPSFDARTCYAWRHNIDPEDDDDGTCACGCHNDVDDDGELC